MNKRIDKLYAQAAKHQKVTELTAFATVDLIKKSVWPDYMQVGHYKAGVSIGDQETGRTLHRSEQECVTVEDALAFIDDMARKYHAANDYVILVDDEKGSVDTKLRKLARPGGGDFDELLKEVCYGWA